MSDGAMILLIFAGILIIPTCCVFFILALSRARRKRKRERYRGAARGTVEKIVHRGGEAPWVIYVVYRVGGVEYRISETAKLKSETIRLGKLPIGQRKTFVLGAVRPGDAITVQYDIENPAKAIIAGNEGWMTG